MLECIGASGRAVASYTDRAECWDFLKNLSKKIGKDIFKKFPTQGWSACARFCVGTYAGL